MAATIRPAVPSERRRRATPVVSRNGADDQPLNAGCSPASHLDPGHPDADSRFPDDSCGPSDSPTQVLALANEDACGLLRRELRPFGVAVATSASVDEAVDRAAATRVEVMALDLDVPAAEELLENVLRQLTELPLVVLHRPGQESLADRALRLGAQETLTWDEARGTQLHRRLRHAVERHRTIVALRRRALGDPLTGLANRNHLLDRVEQALAGVRRGQRTRFALLFLDLDGFKVVNDLLGHAAGDRVLEQLGERLQQSLRSADAVARIGGDEFAVLLADATDEAAALHVAERLAEVVAAPFVVGTEEIRISASVGIALSSGDDVRAEDLLRDADTAMYRAKAVGPGNCRVFDPAMHLAAVAVLRLEQELRAAVDEGAFVMHYQPIVSLEDGGITGFEALLRWHHPQRGLLPVGQFLAVAETSGLIVPIGWWALRQACRQVRDWQLRHARPLEVSVNVSPRLLMQDGMVERLEHLLTETGVEPGGLRLEVTEQLVSDHGEAAVSRLRAIRSLGVRLSLDDFGTGYSSLRQLPELLCDAVKIDGSFLDGLTDRDRSSRLVETVLALASGLGMSVVAEGVETAGQGEALRRLGCPQGQGYWFARPLEPAAAEALLTRPPGWWKSVD